MKTLYIDCGMGAAGDMLTAALLELLPDQEAFLEELNGIGIPGVQVKKERVAKCGIQGTHMVVTVDGAEEEAHDYHVMPEHGHDHHEHDHHEHDHHEHDHHEHDHHEHDHHEHDHHEHHHSSMQDIREIVEQLSLPKEVQEDVLAVYSLIAEAESHAHGAPVTEIHFHEVGTKDAIADVAAVCLLMHKLSPQEVVVSPIHVGSGHVHCAHGILPVPAPATAYILQGVPIYGGRIRGELCTPTGAALLKHFATRFGDMPVMTTEAIGYGMGKKDFEIANCVRVLYGETADSNDVVYELSCNVDDMTAEAVGFAMEQLLERGALEVYTVPIGMKKSRPGTMLRVMCRQDDRERMARAMFKYTTTIGVRESRTKRYVLDRSIEAVNTPYGEIRYKKSSGYGVERMKYEYEDLARIAREQSISIEAARALVESPEVTDSFGKDLKIQQK